MLTLLRHVLRDRALLRSTYLLSEAWEADFQGYPRAARWYRKRANIWFSRHLLLAGLMGWSDYAAQIRRIKSEHRRPSGSAASPGTGGGERSEGAEWPPSTSPFVPLTPSSGGRP